MSMLSRRLRFHSPVLAILWEIWRRNRGGIITLTLLLLCAGTVSWTVLRDGTVERSTFSAREDRLCRPTISKQKRRVLRNVQALRSHAVAGRECENEVSKTLRMNVVSLV